tara:strand:+ start:107 stop:697 length:591 start_codon:yes stop_codon:yes gene_type:complete
LSIRADKDLADVVKFDNNPDMLQEFSINRHKSSVTSNNSSSASVIEIDDSANKYNNKNVQKIKIPEGQKIEEKSQKAPESIIKIYLKFFRISNELKIVVWGVLYLMLFSLVFLVLSFIWDQREPNAIEYFPENCSQHPDYLELEGTNGISFCAAMTLQNCISFESNYTVTQYKEVSVYAKYKYNSTNNDGARADYA